MPPSILASLTAAMHSKGEMGFALPSLSKVPKMCVSEAKIKKHLEDLPDKYARREYIKELVNTNGWNLEQIPKEINALKDKTLVKMALKQLAPDVAVFKRVDVSLKEDEDFVLELLNDKTLTSKTTDNKDTSTVLGKILEYCGENVRNNVEILKAAVDKNKGNCKAYQDKLNRLLGGSESLTESRNPAQDDYYTFIGYLKHLQKAGIDDLKEYEEFKTDMPENLETQKAFECIEAQTHLCELKDVESKEYQDNKDNVKRAIELGGPKFFKYADDQLQEDVTFVLELLNNQTLISKYKAIGEGLLENASDDIKYNPEVIKAAVDPNKGNYLNQRNSRTSWEKILDYQNKKNF